MRYASWAAVRPISPAVRLPFGRGHFDQSRERRDGPLASFSAYRGKADIAGIEEVDPENMERHFPGVRLLNFEIEVTDAPLTRVLTKRLPWLETIDRNETLERDPAGSMRPLHERPVAFLIHQGDFFGTGWERMLHVK